jgi:predicted nucleotide-binding protein
MPAPKPKLFVGSSSEAKEIARKFCGALNDIATTVLWDKAPEFEPTKCTLAGIFKAIDEYDFGLFILTPDDHIVSRGVKGSCARDNVILELGCFLGKLGADRTFAVTQETHAKAKNKKIKIISDLDGIHIPHFSVTNKHEILSSIDAAVQKIRDKISEVGRIRKKYNFHKRWGVKRDSKECFIDIRCDPIKENKKQLIGKSLLIIGRKRDENCTFEEDTNIFIGKTRKLSRFISENFSLKLKLDNEEFQDTDWADMCLLLVPETVDISKAKTIAEMEEFGCDIQQILSSRNPKQDPIKEFNKGKKAKLIKKAPAKKAPVKKKPAKLTATDQVLKILKGRKRGVDTATIMAKTGLNQKQVWNIIHRAYKTGKIKRVGKGLYVAE